MTRASDGILLDTGQGFRLHIGYRASGGIDRVVDGVSDGRDGVVYGASPRSWLRFQAILNRVSDGLTII